MLVNQRKQFYAKQFHSRLGPLTNTMGHVQVPKANGMPMAPRNNYYNGAGFKPVFKQTPNWATQWDSNELSAATFRQQALQNMGDEPHNSFAPPRPAVARTRQALGDPFEEPRTVQAPQPPQRVKSKQEPLHIVNAPLNSLDVLVGNSSLTTQPKQNLIRKATYLVQENGLPDIYSDGVVSFSTPTTVCALELLLEITGPLQNFSKYCSDASEARFVSFYAGTNKILGNVTCWADYLMHGTLESYEFGEYQLHLFRMPLGCEAGQGLTLRDKAKLKVSVENLDLKEMKEAGFRHRFIVRYFEEKR